jgi:putative chitinase
MAITAAQIKRFCPQAASAIVDGIVTNQWMFLTVADISTPLRLCHFMAQIAIESDHLKVTREYASGAAYEGRADLGNTQPGDGTRYRGRGVIQTTGRANYTEALNEIRKLYPDCPDFVAEPQRLEKFPWALLSALIYWRRRNINRPADRDDALAVTRAVNGGTNGLESRTAYLAKAKTIWGDASVSAEPVTDSATVAMTERGASGAPAAMAPSLDKHTAVMLIQSVLRSAGHDPGALDGIWGQHTDDALSDLVEGKR